MMKVTNGKKKKKKTANGLFGAAVANVTVTATNVETELNAKRNHGRRWLFQVLEIWLLGNTG